VIAVHEDVLPDPVAYRAAALAQPYGAVDTGAAIFHGIAVCANRQLAEWFERQYPGWRAGLTFFRQSPAGQHEPHFIHTDVDMGEMTTILYLTPEPPAGDGTGFWKHCASGAIHGGPVPKDLGQALDAWERWLLVPAAFNRAVVFETPYFHARALPENYGTGEAARLIQVLFAVRE
jgi:hypothetical protein